MTGANGFVGSHIAEELIKNNHQIKCIVRESSNLTYLKNLNLTYLKADFNDENSLKECLKDIDVIVHCAGALRAKNKMEYFDVNVENTKKLCNAALLLNPKPKKFIFISSQAAMGPSKSEIPKTLGEKENPVSDYGLSKLEAEKCIADLLLNKIPYTILRPASVYGPRDKDIFIFFNLVHKHLRPKTLKKRKLQLVFVKDIAKAAASSIDNKKSDNKTFFLAHQKTYTWEEVAKTIAKAASKKTFILPLPDFAFHCAAWTAEIIAKITGKSAILNKQKITEMLQPYWIADNEPAKRDLELDFTSLEKGSEITYNWYIDNKCF
jgi:nucleoside-diphosphate-sugar epimerase